MKIGPGQPYPLGSTWNGEGTNFAIYSEHAERVWLCLFDSPRGRHEGGFLLPEVTAHVHHGYFPEVKPGQLYGYRMDGPYDPVWYGRRFNRNKLLIDPYARALAGRLLCRPEIFGYPAGHPDQDLALDRRNDARYVPKGVVLDNTESFDWRGDRCPNTSLRNSVIYEVHVKGFTNGHPSVPASLRGTYAGLHSPAALSYLVSLGVTAIELLPIHAFADDGLLVERGLVNYWGYNTINFFTPEGRFAASGNPAGQLREFKTMVKALHAAGIELILDVVYNHTAEGNHLGPTLSYRGIDNTTYYRLAPDQPRQYTDHTGTGNTLNLPHPQVLKLVLDSLRYWVQEMHIDGFRFDLAPALAREPNEFHQNSSFFNAVYQDPVLSRVKLIAEPWDVGPDGYQVGHFPILWSEWNGRYRDSVRRYWKGDEGLISELAYRVSGSSDLYASSGRRPSASINFVTAHDGFTLRDLVSYDEKHNQADGEENRDGSDQNDSWNYGVEGPTDDLSVLALRARQQRNFLATLLLSQGVPMILGGDEIGRTQRGNNNAYCQDNETSWFDWNLGDEQQQLLDWTRRLIRFRLGQPVLRRNAFLRRRPQHGSDFDDLAWFQPDGTEMAGEEWDVSFARSLTVRLSGEALSERDENGDRLAGDSLVLFLNSHHEPLAFNLPVSQTGGTWEVVFDTDKPDLQPGCRVMQEGGEPYQLSGRALVVLRALSSGG